MRRGRKFPSDLRSPSAFAPLLHRPHTVLTVPQKLYERRSYRDICLSRISKAFQGKPVIRDFSLTIKRESSRQKRENSCHKDPPALLAMPLASLLVTICLLLWMVQNAIKAHKSDSLVGGNSKRMTLTPLSPSCVGSDSRRGISPSLTTPNFSVRRRIAKTRKESQDPRNRKSSLGNAPRHRPCHRHHALLE